MIGVYDLNDFRVSVQHQYLCTDDKKNLNAMSNVLPKGRFTQGAGVRLTYKIRFQLIL